MPRRRAILLVLAIGAARRARALPPSPAIERIAYHGWPDACKLIGLLGRSVTDVLGVLVNGAIAASAEPDDLAHAILQVLEAGSTLRTSTARWFEENAPRLRLEESLKLVVREYEGAKAEDALQPHGV